jgi:hypothetical protein
VDISYHTGGLLRYPRSMDLDDEMSLQGQRGRGRTNIPPAQHLMPSHIRVVPDCIQETG